LRKKKLLSVLIQWKIPLGGLNYYLIGVFFARGSEVGRFSPGAIDFLPVWWCLADAHHRATLGFGG
jgi:hypothetical protein